MSKRLAAVLATVLGAALPFVSCLSSAAQNACDPNTNMNCPAVPDQNGNGNGYNNYPSQGNNPQYPSGDVGGSATGSPLHPNGPLLTAPYTPSYVDNLQGANGAARTAENSRGATANVYYPPTEFQQLVAASVGRMLPIYGANLFLASPSTFAPVDQIPVTPDYLIGPGDQLLIRVWGQINFNAEVTVDRSGVIYLPQVGAIQVAGIPYSDLQKQLRSNIGRIYRNFDLSANLGQLRSIRIFVTGQARRPGTYTVSALSTLISALFATGGPAPDGSLRHIEVRRNGATVTDLDLYALLVRGDKSKDVPLVSGDVIYIPPVGPQVAVFGSVRNQAIFELLGNTTVSQVLQDAGGLSVIASLTRASLEHIDPQQRQQVVDLALDAAGMASILHNGDILRVLPISPQFDKTVTVRGNLADPGRFAWHAGMRLDELLPNSQALITRDYWQRRNQLGLPSPAFQPDYTQRFQALAASRSQSATGYGVPQSGYPQTNGQVQPGTTQQQNQYQGGYQQGSGVNASPNQSLADQLAAQPVNTQNGASSNGNGASQYVPSTEIGGSTLAEQQRLTSTENTANAASLTDVTLPAPEIDWSYAVIERLDPVTLRTTLLPFDLGKLVMDHDISQNLAVEPGDVITIFSQADIHVPLAQQTKLVRLEGEIAHGGIYSVQPGETLRQLVERAGGLTQNAYLFGAELTRESTRVIQQQRLDDYVSNLELEIDRASASTAARAISQQDQATASSSLSATQLLVSRLRRVRATGRIVLNVKPDATALASLPELPLEDGDRFVVPARPSSINVVGAVYDQNSFIFDVDRSVKGYLHQAGGANRDADPKHAFLIRADGSVISRESANTIWGNAFEQARVNPGDTIVVPEKIYRGSGFRDFLNYSQIFSSLAFGAASLALVTR